MATLQEMDSWLQKADPDRYASEMKRRELFAGNPDYQAYGQGSGLMSLANQAAGRDPGLSAPVPDKDLASWATSVQTSLNPGFTIGGVGAGGSPVQGANPVYGPTSTVTTANQIGQLGQPGQTGQPGQGQTGQGASGLTNGFTSQMEKFTRSLSDMFPNLNKMNTGSISAADRAAELMEEDSVLLKLAKMKATQEGNRRGLLNSSMTAGAGTQAMLAEAGRYGQIDAGNELAMQQTQLGHQARLRDQIGDFGMGMQRDEALWNRQDARDQSLWAREDERDKTLWGRQDTQRAEERNWQVADRESGWARTDAIDQRDFERNLQTAYTSSVDGITTKMTADINAIQASELPADVKAEQIAAVQAAAKTQVEFRNTLFAAMPGWKEEWAQFSMSLADGPA